MREMRREPEVPEESPSGRMFRWPRKDYFKGTCINSFCEKWHPPECLFHKAKSGCIFGEKCSYAHRQVDEQPGKRSQKNDDESVVAMLKKHGLYTIERGDPLFAVTHVARKATEKLCAVHRVHDNWVASFRQWSRRSCHQFYGRAQTCRKPIQRVKFTKATARYDKIRDQNPSFGYICPGEPHQRIPNASKFDDRSQEETEWQEQGAREAAWKLAKSVLKLKEHERATCFSPSEKKVPACINS